MVSAAGLMSALAPPSGAAAQAPGGDAPFAVAASAGPQAGARVDASVTRVVDGKRVTLPAAVVPALEPGDQVSLRFPDYSPPATAVRYHANVAFITEAAPQRWLFERSGTADRLFDVRRGRTVATAAPRTLTFTYGRGRFRGIPIVFIVPEDAKTRGMDGARDYVDAHPTDFKDMSESANDAVDRYAWFRDFLASLAQGSIDPVSGRERVEDVAASLGADRSTVDLCYQEGGSQADVTNCVQNALSSVSYQTNIEAPSQAQFFGGVAGAAAPLQMAAYLVPLLAVWQIFARAGHQEYEYLPTTLDMTAPKRPGAPGDELLFGMKVPTLRPPAARSDVLFFTIGDPQAAATPPVVANASESGGVCARSERFTVPLHLDRTSKYVHDTALVVTPDGKPSYTIPVDPHALDAPAIPRARLAGSADGGYAIALRGRFGFTPIVQPVHAVARVAVPGAAAWSVAPLPHRTPVAGGALDVVATSASAPCLSAAELQIGDAPPIPLQTKVLDDRRVELQASLANVPAGTAHLRFYEDDVARRGRDESAVTLAIVQRPPHVDLAQSPPLALGDRFVALAGSGLERVAAVKIGGVAYAKTVGSTGTSACFAGPPFDGTKEAAGTSVPAELIGGDGAPGEAFAEPVVAARPVLRTATLSGPGAADPTHLSTQTLDVALSVAGALPAQRDVRVRRASAETSPCDAVRDDGGAATISAADTHLDGASALSVYLRAADALGDAAFGTLQVQLVDAATKLASAWTAIPGTFVRAPQITAIECGAGASCTLVGTGLAAIDGVEDASGRFVAPSFDCASDVKGKACRSIPRERHYTLRLEDGATLYRVPDAAITGAGDAKPPAPAKSAAEAKPAVPPASPTPRSS